jgi:hypothetical protein
MTLCENPYVPYVVKNIRNLCGKKNKKMTNTFTEEYLRKAAADQVQGDFTPFNKNDIGKVKRYVKGMLGRLSDNKRINVAADFSAYGSGFASYINVKISKKDKSDTVIEKNGNRTIEKKDAILVYISLLAPYWYFGKGDWWDNYTNGEFSGGSSNFLMPDSINQYNKPLWETEIEQITRLFEEFRYGLLTKKEVEQPLWFDVEIEANIGEKPYMVFDCLFHCED